MQKKPNLNALVFVLVGVVSLMTFATPSAQAAPNNVLLITLDTTRADRIGCYGYEKAVTPGLDALAQRGTLFEQTFCQVPITLPSHATILTGKYPRQHGISHNGRERLASDQITLAHLARDAGYKTGAFVAAFVLDARFGLGQAFDVYADDMETNDRSNNPLEWEQPANVVTDRALTWLETVKSTPFFCWVHYFDPHDPYAPPADFKNVGADPYDGEIAFMDSQLRRLTDWLAKSGLEDSTLVVVVGDHGESFGEHKEVGHTLFLYDTNIHVPMIFAHPKLIETGHRVSTVVETLDVFSTIAELQNWKVPQGVAGRSLVPALQGKQLDPGRAYSESLYGMRTYGWCEQRSLTTDRWKYISSVKPELYDRKADPGEIKNLVDEHPDRAREFRDSLRQMFEAMPIGTADGAEFDLRAEQALRDIGYVGGSPLTSNDFLSEDKPDPKENLDILKLLTLARKATRAGEHEVAVFHLLNIKDRAPESSEIQSLFGVALLNLYDKQAERLNGVGDFMLLEKAVDAFGRTIELDPKNEMAMAALGDVFVRQKKYEDAIRQYRRVLEGGSPYPEIHLQLAAALRAAGKPQQAIEEWKRAIELAPESADAYYQLGSFHLEMGHHNEAIRYLHDAVRFNHENARAHYNLGLALFNLQQFEAAATEFKIASQLDPDHGDAAINLGIAQFEAGQIGPAQGTLMQASQNPKTAAEAFYNLGVMMEKQNRPRMAMGFYDKACLLKPDHLQAVHRAVALLLSERASKRAVEILRNAIKAYPNDVALLNTLASVLATSNKDAVRNGSEAVAIAQRASSLTADAHPEVLQTLATAYAEVGDFAKATETAEKAIQLARAANRNPLAERIEAQRAGYKEGKPVRSDTH